MVSVGVHQRRVRESVSFWKTLPMTVIVVSCGIPGAKAPTIKNYASPRYLLGPSGLAWEICETNLVGSLVAGLENRSGGREISWARFGKQREHKNEMAQNCRVSGVYVPTSRLSEGGGCALNVSLRTVHPVTQHCAQQFCHVLPL